MGVAGAAERRRRRRPLVAPPPRRPGPTAGNPQPGGRRPAATGDRARAATARRVDGPAGDRPGSHRARRRHAPPSPPPPSAAHPPASPPRPTAPRPPADTSGQGQWRSGTGRTSKPRAARAALRVGATVTVAVGGRGGASKAAPRHPLSRPTRRDPPAARGGGMNRPGGHTWRLARRLSALGVVGCWRRPGSPLPSPPPRPPPPRLLSSPFFFYSVLALCGAPSAAAPAPPLSFRLVRRWTGRPQGDGVSAKGQWLGRAGGPIGRPIKLGPLRRDHAP